MRITRAAAGLLLLALVLGAQAGSKCAHCGLGEGSNACHHAATGVVAQKLEKPEVFASPEAIKNALKRKSKKPAPPPIHTTPKPSPAYSAPAPTYSAPAPSYSAPAASYGSPAASYSAAPASYSAPAGSYGAPTYSYSTPAISYGAPAASYGAPAISYGAPAASYGSAVSTYGAASPAYSAAPAPSPVSYYPTSTPPPRPTPSPPIRSKSYVETTCRNNTGSYGNGKKHRRDNEDLAKLLSLKPGTSIAPKFEPIGDLCLCKADDVVGVVPARPGKLPKPEPKPEPTTPAPPPVSPAPAPTPVYQTPVPAPTYSAPAPSYSAPAPSYSAPAPSYSAPVLSYGAPASSYSSAPVLSYSAPASLYNSPTAPVQYASAYQNPAPASYSAPPPTPTATSAPTQASAQYATAQQQSAPVIYVIGGAAPSSAKKITKKSKSRCDCGKDKGKRQVAANELEAAAALAQYAPAYQQPAPASYLTATNSLSSESAAQFSADYASAAQASANYASAAPAPKTKKPCKKNKQPSDLQALEDYASAAQFSADYASAAQASADFAAAAQASANYASAAPAPKTKKPCKKNKEPSDIQALADYASALQASVDYASAAQFSADYAAAAQASADYAAAAQAAAANYASTAQGSASYGSPAQASANYASAVPAPKSKKPSKKNKQPSDHDKDEREAQAYVEIQLQKEQAPRYTADPVSVAMAFKRLADAAGKRPVLEDSLAYGHYREPSDGRVLKRVSNFDEEKLHTLDKPIVELKCGKCGNDDCPTLQISYSDIGYGEVGPSKNRFVPKTDDNSPCGPAVIYVPPAEDKKGLPCGPLGPTIPGYKSGKVIRGDSNGKSSCGCCGKKAPVEEGSRQVELIGCKCQSNDSGDYENDKGGIIKRIKSSSCKCGKS